MFKKIINKNQINILDHRYCSVCHNFLDKDKESNIGYCCKECLDLINLNLYLPLDLSTDIDTMDINTINLVPIYSFYTYQNIIKDLILRVKIKKDFIVLNIIKDLFMMNIENSGIMKKLNINKIVPTYSSLWSRLRGKFDIAYFLANELSSNFNIPLVPPSIQLGWNFIKRSKNKNKNRNKSDIDSKEIFQLSSSNTDFIKDNILIVDDIITTGDTLKKLVSYFPHDSIKFISFARSSNFKENYIKLHID